MAECEEDSIVIIDDDDDDNDVLEVSSTSATATVHETEKETMECPICLQPCIHPAKLPCGHIFCFLCVKGVAYKNRRCAMCRREIPPEFLDHPQLIHGIQDLCTTKTTEDGYQWFYEGRNGGWWEYDIRSSAEIEDAFNLKIAQYNILLCGSLYTIDFDHMTQYRKDARNCKRKIKRERRWWQYDERTSQDIEDAYKKGEKSCTILVAGYVYVVDFAGMLQQRQNDPSRRRHVKRDLASIPKKGVAGLRIEGNTVATDSNFASQYHRSLEDSITIAEDDTSNVYNPQPTNNYISTIAATDAAIRIASDIIDSTLAHADDISSRSGHNDQGSGSNAFLGNRELHNQSNELLDNTANSISSQQHQDAIDLFEQTFNDFQLLTLNNVIENIDSEDDNNL